MRSISAGDRPAFCIVSSIPLLSCPPRAEISGKLGWKNNACDDYPSPFGVHSQIRTRFGSVCGNNVRTRLLADFDQCNKADCTGNCRAYRAYPRRKNRWIDDFLEITPVVWLSCAYEAARRKCDEQKENGVGRHASKFSSVVSPACVLGGDLWTILGSRSVGRENRTHLPRILFRARSEPSRDGRMDGFGSSDPSSPAASIHCGSRIQLPPWSVSSRLLGPS